MDVQESQIYITIIIAVIVFGFAIGYFFYSIVKQNKRVRKLERINAEAQIQALEKDRQRIAEDLHDDIAPILRGIQSKIGSFRLVDIGDRECRSETNEEIQELSRRLRTISFDLMPTTLQKKGLLSAIDEFISYASTEENFSISLIAPSTEILMDERRTIHVFRMMKEIVHNTIKHARATELHIALSREKGVLNLSTRDNGIGFDYRQKLKESTGLGLKSLMNRVYLLQAEILIDSQPGKGTSMTIRIPYQDE